MNKITTIILIGIAGIFVPLKASAKTDYAVVTYLLDSNSLPCATILDFSTKSDIYDEMVEAINERFSKPKLNKKDPRPIWGVAAYEIDKKNQIKSIGTKELPKKVFEEWKKAAANIIKRNRQLPERIKR